MTSHNADAENFSPKKKKVVAVFTVPPSKNIGEIENAIAAGSGRADVAGLKNPFGRALSNVFKKVFQKTTVRLQEERGKTESEIKELNDIVYEELGYVLDILEEAGNTIDGNPQAVALINERKETFKRARDRFSEAYVATYGLKPGTRMLEGKLEYKNEELAMKYIEFARIKNKPDPSQSELKEYYKISQSTWSRAQKEREFWDFVVEKTMDALKQIENEKENICNVHTIAADKSEKIRFEQRKNRELPLLSEAEAGMVLSDGEDAMIRIHQKIDIEKRIKNMSKPQLIDTARKLAPILAQNALEMMDIKALCQLIFALRVSS